jgi:alpha-tubulin suppressor-like RCC1 family protein
VRSTGAVRCWGDDFFGQTEVPADLGVVSLVAAGNRHTCALLADGSVRCWGDNADGQLDAPADLGVASQLSAGGAHTCALLADNTVRCWGANRAGQTRVPTYDPEPARTPTIYLPMIVR